MQKEKSEIPPLLLALSGALLLCCAWLMASFPLLVFVGLTPLMALSERGKKADASILEKMELVLLAIAGTLLIHAMVRGTSLASALGMGILLTLAFVAQAWVRGVLGIRTGMITLLLFWLSAEYLVLKIVPQHGIYLADSLALQRAWLRWNTHTGYLGATLWVLLVNGCWYLAFLRHKGLQWFWVVAGLVLLGGPIGYSYSLTHSPISREEMINLYQNNIIDSDVTYLARGELVVRTATWLSALILLFTFVRQQTRK